MQSSFFCRTFRTKCDCVGSHSKSAKSAHIFVTALAVIVRLRTQSQNFFFEKFNQISKKNLPNFSEKLDLPNMGIHTVFGNKKCKKHGAKNLHTTNKILSNSKHIYEFQISTSMSEKRLRDRSGCTTDCMR